MAKLMSTKFSGLSKVQKPPAVCRVPPPPDPIPLPPFAEQIYQGYAEWSDNSGSNRFSVSGFMTMIPDPPFLYWRGNTTGSPYELVLELTWNAPHNSFDFDLNLLKNGITIDTAARHGIPARSQNPFDSGLVNFVASGTIYRIHTRIMA